MTRAHQIPPAVADVLARSAVAGQVVTLPPGQLDRPTYAATDKVLRGLGGRWVRKAGGHVFPFDPAPKLAAALASGSATDRRQALQFFETPPSLAARLCAMIHIGPGDRCLEPSAEHGRIALAMAARQPDSIAAVEVDPDNAAVLGRCPVLDRIVIGDFLAQPAASLPATAIAMNSPFTRNQDITHVRHAFDCLLPGGRLVAIVSEHGFIGRARECSDWRDWLDARGARIEQLPAGTFATSGTGVAARIILLERGYD